MSAEPGPATPLGAYEHLVTSGLLRSVEASDQSQPVFGELDRADAPTVLSRHIAALSLRALRSVNDALSGQVDLANRIVSALRSAAPQVFDRGDDDIDRAQLLLALLKPTAPPPDGCGTHPSGGAVRRQRAVGEWHRTAAQRHGGWPPSLHPPDALDLLCAFVKWRGLASAPAAIREARMRGCP